MDGDVLFSWNGDPSQLYYVLLTKDGKVDIAWHQVTGTQFTVEDALLYDSIRIKVRLPCSCVESNLAYKGILYIFNYCYSYIK